MVAAIRPRRLAPSEVTTFDLSTVPVPPEPHAHLGADTATLHLWLVESAVCFFGPDADAIGAAVCLPPWNVKRALHALGLGPPANPNPKQMERRAERTVDLAAAYLRGHGPATARQVAKAIGRTAQSMTTALALYRVRFRRCGSAPGYKGRPVALWEVA